jgi:hypothetical protein
MIYAVFVCLHYAAAPQLDNCRIMRVNGEAMYFQSIAECKKITATLNARVDPRAATFQKWTCMGKPAWQPAN